MEPSAPPEPWLDATISGRPGPTGTPTRSPDGAGRVGSGTRMGGSGGANDTDARRAVSTRRGSSPDASFEGAGTWRATAAGRGLGMPRMVADDAHPPISCDEPDGHRPRAGWFAAGDGDRGRSALVLEADLDLDVVLDDLAVLDPGRGLHDLDRADVADGPRGGRDGLAGRVAPRARAGPDHLPDDDDAHAILLERQLTDGRVSLRPGDAGASAGPSTPRPTPGRLVREERPR